MSLFGFGKKKEEEKKMSCCCGTGEAETTFANTAVNDEISSIKVLGAGCKSCHDQYQNVINAVVAMGIATNVEYITDMEKIMSYGVMSMPAIVVNEKVVSMGKVLKTADVMKLLRKSGV
jgi:small redox-active disulfide protein 2